MGTNEAIRTAASAQELEPHPFDEVLPVVKLTARGLRNAPAFYANAPIVLADAGVRKIDVERPRLLQGASFTAVAAHNQSSSATH